jgi:hypothetical protein
LRGGNLEDVEDLDDFTSKVLLDEAEADDGRGDSVVELKGLAVGSKLGPGNTSVDAVELLQKIEDSLGSLLSFGI